MPASEVVQCRTFSQFLRGGFLLLSFIATLPPGNCSYKGSYSPYKAPGSENGQFHFVTTKWQNDLIQDGGVSDLRGEEQIPVNENLLDNPDSVVDDTLPVAQLSRRMSFPQDDKDARSEVQIQAKFRNWNIVDDAEEMDQPVWSTSSGDRSKSLVDGKTIPLPAFPSLDIVKDPGYDHNSPTWPLNEYLNPGWGRMNSSSTLTNVRDYEWQKLPDYSSSSGMNYDSSKYYHLDYDKVNSEENDGFRKQGAKYNLFKEADSQKMPTSTMDNHATTVSTGIKTAESTIRGTGKHGLPPHYFPPDHYPKKKFRLQIHPAYIAAPIAGLAAFGAASALTKKPLLFELGLVNNKHHGHHGHRPGFYPGHAWPSNNVPVVAQPMDPVMGPLGVTGPDEVATIVKPDMAHPPHLHGWPSHFHHYHHHNHKHLVKPIDHHLTGHLNNGWGQSSHQVHVHHGWEHKPGKGWGHEHKPGWGSEQKPGWGTEQKPGWGHEHKPGWGSEHKPGWGWEHEHKPGWGHDHKPGTGWEEQKPSNGWDQDKKPMWGWGQENNSHKGWDQDKKPLWGWSQDNKGWSHKPTSGWGHEHKPEHGWGQQNKKPLWGWGQQKPTWGWGSKPCCHGKPSGGWGEGEKKPWWNIFAMTPKTHQ